MNGIGFSVVNDFHLERCFKLCEYEKELYTGY